MNLLDFYWGRQNGWHVKYPSQLPQRNFIFAQESSCSISHAGSRAASTISSSSLYWHTAIGLPLSSNVIVHPASGVS